MVDQPGRPRFATVSELASINQRTNREVVLLTDASFYGDVATGGGSIRGQVYHDGTAWRWLGLPNHLALWPAMGFANTTGTATLVSTSGRLQYWQFTDTNAVDRIELTLTLPDHWPGKSLRKAEIIWGTSGTSTATMVWRWALFDYRASTDSWASAGTTVWDTGAVTTTPTGTADSISRTNLSPSGSFTAGSDSVRVFFQRQSNHASDTNADTLRVFGFYLEI